MGMYKTSMDMFCPMSLEEGEEASNQRRRNQQNFTINEECGPFLTFNIFFAAKMNWSFGALISMNNI